MEAASVNELLDALEGKATQRPTAAPMLKSVCHLFTLMPPLSNFGICSG